MRKCSGNKFEKWKFGQGSDIICPNYGIMAEACSERISRRLL
jgi:hypothetical protein